MTIHELIEKIKLALDPYLLLEMLDLEFEELVDHLQDAIEENYAVFDEYFEDDNDE